MSFSRISSLRERRICDFLTRCKHLHDARELVVLLVIHSEGLRYDELIRHNVNMELFDTLLRDGMLEQLFDRFRLSSQAEDIINLVDNQEVLITVQPRYSKIVEHLKQYEIRKKNLVGDFQNDYLQRDGQQICREIRRLYQQTCRELEDLEVELEDNYVHETDWELKKNVLESADRKIQEIERLIWVDTLNRNVSSEQVTRCIVNIIRDYESFYLDYKDIVDESLILLRKLMVDIVGRLRQKISNNLKCVCVLVSTRNTFRDCFYELCIRNGLKKHIAGLMTLFNTVSLPPASHKEAQQNPCMTVLSLDCLSEFEPSVFVRMNNGFDYERMVMQRNISLPDGFGFVSDCTVVDVPDVDGLVEMFMNGECELLELVKSRYPESPSSFLYLAWIRAAIRVLGDVNTKYDTSENGFVEFDAKMKCLKLYYGHE